MLYYNTVYPSTLEWLQKLMNLKDLSNFYLVGGTALALHLGHRISIDLDFFTEEPFEPSSIIECLKSTYPNHSILLSGQNNNALSLQIEDVKVDFVRYAYPLLNPLMIGEGIRLMSVPDIAAAKISAITNRGTKKDFFDLYELLEIYSLQEIFDFFEKKFSMPISLFHLKSLNYFEDAELNPEPIQLNDVSWKDVKCRINKIVKDYI